FQRLRSEVLKGGKVLFVALVLTTCTAHAQTDQSGYAELFSKGEDRHLSCAAAYANKDILLVVTQSKQALGSNLEVTIHNAGSGTFLTYPVIRKVSEPGQRATCDIADLISTPKKPAKQRPGAPKQYANIHYWYSSDFRALWDNAREQPELLSAAIQAGAPYFRSNGQWEGRQTALRLDIRIGIRSLGEAVERLKTTDPGAITGSLMRAVETFEKGQDRGERARKDREAAMRHIERMRAQARGEIPIDFELGQTICDTKTDWFGYVEQVTEARVKLYVVGKLRKGILSHTALEQILYDPIEAMRWTDRSGLVTCEIAPN
ncbi:MAG: hypothetical protein AAF194_00780, partial [Pseudomonadota bacterium]